MTFGKMRKDTTKRNEFMELIGEVPSNIPDKATEKNL